MIAARSGSHPITLSAMIRPCCLSPILTVGTPSADNFELASITLPAPAAGEVQVRNDWMTVDPYMRGRMNDAKSYAAPFALGEAMHGGAIGTVVASADEGFKPGDLVQSNYGWREAFNAHASMVQKLDTMGLPPQAFLGAAGMPGMTAYAGLLRVAALKDGDVVFVSAASGAVRHSLNLSGATRILTRGRFKFQVSGFKHGEAPRRQATRSLLHIPLETEN